MYLGISGFDQASLEAYEQGRVHYYNFAGTSQSLGHVLASNIHCKIAIGAIEES